MRQMFLLGVFIASLAMLVGCSGGPPLNAVEGVVSAGGQPLDKIQVEFFPEKADGPVASAVTDTSGKFVLKVADGRTGAMVGKSKIVLRDAGVWGDKIGRMNEGKDLAKGKKIRIPAQYSDLKTTPLSHEVTSGARNEVKLEVK